MQLRFLSLEFMQERCKSLPKSHTVLSGEVVHESAAGFDAKRTEQACLEVEAWFVRQIPVFALAEPDLLPLDVKGALADIAYAKLKDTASGSKDERGRAEEAQAFIVYLAPSYDGAQIDPDTAEIILDEEASLIDLMEAWDE